MKRMSLDITNTKRLAWHSEPKNDIKNPSLIYWKTYFDITYYLQLSNFRFIWNESTYTWELRRSGPIRKVICLTLALCAIPVSTLENLSPYHLSESLNNLLKYFSIASFFSIIFYIWSFFVMNWSREKQLLAVFHKLQDGIIGRSKLSLNTSIKEKLLICLYISIFGVQEILFALHDLQLSEWNLDLYLKNCKAKIVKTLLVFSGDVDNVASQITTPIILFWILVQYYFKMMFTFTDITFISSTLFYRSLVSDYLEEFKNPNLTPAQFIRNYKYMKELFILINNAVGTSVFCATMGALPFFCEILTGFPSMKSKLFQARMSIYLIYTFGGFAVVGITQAKLSGIYEWLHTHSHYKRMGHLDLHLLLHDLSSYGFGLTCVGQPLSFRFFGTMLATTATYIIVKVQVDPSGI